MAHLDRLGADLLLALSYPAIPGIAHVTEEDRQRAFKRAHPRVRPPARGDPVLHLCRPLLPRPATQAAAEAAWAEAVVDDTSAEAEGAGSAADDAVNAESPDPARPSLPLSELRPGAPESAGTRVLFTVEPPGTAVLLAAGMEDDWLRAWYTEAIANCRIRYQREEGSTR